MNKFKAIVSYDGTNYHGYQLQPKNRTVQEEIETALKKMTNHDIKTFAASRTDKGVHARGQVFHFETQLDINNDKFKDALNKRLPNDIRIIHIDKVCNEFHARHDSKSKLYEYTFSKNELTPFNSRYEVYYDNLDFELMKIAATKFLGEHDFTAFGKDVEEKITVKNIYISELVETKDKYIYRIHGNNFLKYMVRSIVGVMIDIGLKKKNLEIIDKMFETKDRKLTSKTALAQGLCLMEVYY